MKSLYPLLLCLTGPAFAQSSAACEELWFARNAMINNAGFCFSSPLGQAAFDNSDCTTENPAVDPRIQLMINRIRENEAALQCRVDTDRATFETIETDWGENSRLHLSARLALDVQPPSPADSLHEFSCGQYAGAPEPVYAAPWQTSQVIATLSEGGWLSFQHDVHLQDRTLEPVDQAFWEIAGRGARIWTYAHIEPTPDAPWSVGWLFLPARGHLAPLDEGGVCGVIAG